MTMLSSDIKHSLTTILASVKREELVDLVQKWGVLSNDCSQEFAELVSRSARQAPRRTILQRIVDECLKLKISKTQLSQLDLLRTICYPERKKWSVYELKGLPEDHHKKAFDHQAFFKKMTQNLSAYFKHDLCMDQRGLAVWLRIGVYEKSQSIRSLLGNAIFIVYYPHSRHVIMANSRKGTMDFIIQTLIQSLGCTSLKESKLTGRYVDSLMDLTLNQASQGWFSKFRLNQVDTNPLVKTETRKRSLESLDLEDKSLISENAEDEKRRQTDLDDSFGPNKQPRLEKLVYEMETKFRGTKAAPGMSVHQEPFRCTVRFEGSNVLEGLKQLHPSGVSSAPLPYLFQQVLTSSKNHFRIHDKPAREKTAPEDV